MAAFTYPSVDQNLVGRWPTVAQNWYNALPVYFAAFQTERSKKRNIYQSLVPGRFSWQPNMGPIMRRIAQEMPPRVRQTFAPRMVDAQPLTDITVTRERYNEVRVYWHRFQSPVFNFYPEWTDFKRHVDINLTAVQDLVDDAYDIFLRERMLAFAPYVYVAGRGFVKAPAGLSYDAGTGTYVSKKNLAWWQGIINQSGVAPVSDLNFASLWQALNAAETQIGMQPYSGSGLQSGDSKPLDSKFCLITSGERWNNWLNDPWLKENRPLNMNIVTDSFKGDFFGRITTKIESFPIRLLRAADGSLTLPAPEKWVQDAEDVGNSNRAAPDPDYSENSQFEVSFLLGGKFGSRMDVGAPPAAFSSTVNGVKGMSWNGKAYMNNQFIIPGVDSDGNTVNQLSSEWGGNLRIQAQLAMGYAPDTAWNVLPVLHNRVVGLTTSGATA